LQHAVRYAPEKDLDTLANFTRAKFGVDVDLQLALFNSVQDGTAPTRVETKLGRPRLGC